MTSILDPDRSSSADDPAPHGPDGRGSPARARRGQPTTPDDDLEPGGSSGSAGGGLPVHRIVASVWTRRWWLPVFALLGALAGMAAHVVLPIEFKSQGQMVWLGGGESFDLATFSDEAGYRGGLVETAPYLFHSQEVCRRVLERMPPERILADEADNPTFEPEGDSPVVLLQRQLRAVRRLLRDRRDTHSESAALGWMLSNLRIFAPRRSNVVMIEYTARDPEAARDTLQTFMEEALRFHLEVYGDEKEIELIERRAADTAERLASAREDLQEMEETLGVDDVESALSTLLVELRRTEEALEAARADEAQATDRIVRNEKALEAVSRYKPIEDLELLRLDREIAQKQIELRQRQAQFKEGDEVLDRLTGQLAQLQEQRREREIEIKQNPDLLREDNLVWYDLDRELGNARFLQQQSLARIEKLEPDVDRLEARIAALRGARREFRRRKEEVSWAADAHERAQERLRLARDKAANSAAGISALRPSQPTLGARATPHLSKMLLVGVAGGLGAALVLFAGLGFLDRRILRSEDLARATGLPVLGVFPAPGRRDVRRHVRSRRLRC